MKEKVDVPKYDKYFLEGYIPKLSFEDILALNQILMNCGKN